MTTISPREEVVLSYLVGLGPMGEELHVNREHFIKDCEIKNRAYVSRDLRSLHIAGAIDLKYLGYRTQMPILTVLKRPEEFRVVDGMYGRSLLIREAFVKKPHDPVKETEWERDCRVESVSIRMTKFEKNKLYTLAHKKRQSITKTVLELVDGAFEGT